MTENNGWFSSVLLCGGFTPVVDCDAYNRKYTAITSVDVPVPLVLEEIVKVVQTIPGSISLRFVGWIIGTPVPQI